MEGNKDDKIELETVESQASSKDLPKSESPFIPDDDEKEQPRLQGCCSKLWLICRYKVYNPENIPTNRLTTSAAGNAFRDRAGLEGFTQLHDSPNGTKKIYWAILILIAFALLVGHTYRLVSRFMEFRTNIEMEVETEKILHFPAVTVCNNNMVRITEAELANSIRQYDKYIDYLAINRSNLGHQKEDLIPYAIFNNELVDLDEFKLIVNPYYGNCYTFNMDGERKTRRALPGYGLQLHLNIESYQYDNIANHHLPGWTGALIKVHQSNTEAVMSEGAIAVAPGTSNRIAIKKTTINRLNGVYGDCLEDGVKGPEIFYQGSYTKEHCENTCLQRAVVNHSCCYIKLLNRDLDQLKLQGSCAAKGKVYPPACEDEDKSSWDKVWEQYDKGNLACDECVNRCNDVLYDVSSTSVTWPTIEYINQVLYPKLADPNSNASVRLAKELRKHQKNISVDLIEQNFLQVHIYFESMTTTKISEVAAVAPSEFASEVGSALGFWAGWTMWTLFQFIEFISDLITICIRRHRRRNNSHSNA